MILFDTYVVYLMIFCPLLGAIFITLIPTSDVGSKRSISRFFGFIGFIAFFRVFILFFNNKLLEQYVLSFNLSQFYANFSININKYNILLFGAISASILANILLHELNDIKSNAHQVAPFILTFVLFITFGQKDIRVALPIISISNFIIYFLIGYNEKIRRGSTIFHMGTFLFTCDTLALILLQYQDHNNANSLIDNILKIAIIIPGFARLILPIFAPFMKNLFLNLDESEGPFIVIFLQLAGFFMLILYRLEFADAPLFINQVAQIITALSALYVAFLALGEHKANITPYHFLVLYSSLAACLLFLDNITIVWYLSSGLLLTNIACFFHNTKIALMVSQYQHISMLQSKVKATWFLSLCLFAAIPGFGIGTSLWHIIFVLMTNHLMGISLAFFWFVALLLMQYVLILSARKEYLAREELRMTIVDLRFPLSAIFTLSPFFVALLTLFIPLIALYAAHKVQ